MPSERKKQHLPVLIIPGFMSSGLIIQKSSHKPWEGKRLWLNIASAGFNSLHVGGALRKNEETRRSTRQLRVGNVIPLDQSSEQMHQQYLRQVECKSKWVRHMRLKDMIHEHDNIVVRAVPGTAGVDYLAPGALTESASWVFGPVLKLLKAEGYIEGVDLGAAPYDWRVPPSELERRDNYFTNTIKQVELLYKKSNDTQVVLLCHSMGCKTGHYLLNFVLHKKGKKNGQAWIDKHIHSYVPVGAPHLGAQKSIRGIVDGDKMGLEAFLDEDEGLMLGRSFGSVPWLFPTESVDGAEDEAPLPQPPPIPAVILRNDATLRIILPAQKLNLKSFVHNRKKLPPTKLRLAIQIGDDVIVRTDFVDVKKEGHTYSSLHIRLDEGSWLIACPPTLQDTLKLYPYIQLHLEEPGTGSAPVDRKTICTIDLLWIFRVAWCIICWVLCCPCSVMWKLGCTVMKVGKQGADMAAAALGDIRVIGQSGPMDWKKGLINNRLTANDESGEGGCIMYQLWANISTTDNVRYGLFLKKPTPEKCTISVKWEPSTVTQLTSELVCDGKKRGLGYNSSCGNRLLEMEGLYDAIHLVEDTYSNDPMGPNSLSAYHPPPVKKVTAIFGINLKTEVSGVYKRSPSVRISMTSTRHKVQQMFVLDKDARLSKKGHSTHLCIGDGVIYETKNTPQQIIGGGGGTEKKSGDGTVAYWSLQHVRKWHGACEVTVHEIDGAEHRAILNDKKFHSILLELLGCR